MQRKGDAHHALSQFIHDVGIPRNCLSDLAPEEWHGDWGRIIWHYHIKTRTTEARTPWQNRAEAAVRETKKLSDRALRKTGTPVEFWCYAIEWAARILSLTAKNLPALKSRTPEEAMVGHTPDISEFAHYTWFEWVWYRDVAAYPETSISLGRWIGVVSDVGQPMTFWILTQQSIFECKKLSSEFESPWIMVDSREPDPTPEEDIEIYPTPEADDFTPESYDEYLSAQVVLPVGNELMRGEVLRRRRDWNGRPIGVRNSNPILDTREYEVVFPDGSSQSYAANVIAENLYSQVDEEGHSYAILQEIVDHERDDSAVTLDELATSEMPCFTTVGWRFLVFWKDGSTSYVPLHEMKDAYPIEVAEYATSNSIAHEPAFKWWVPYVLKKQGRIISKVAKGKGKYWSRTHKYGIELPKSVAEALEIDL
jgi:hypothetical protein